MPATPLQLCYFLRACGRGRPRYSVGIGFTRVGKSWWGLSLQSPNICHSARTYRTHGQNFFANPLLFVLFALCYFVFVTVLCLLRMYHISLSSGYAKS